MSSMDELVEKRYNEYLEHRTKGQLYVDDFKCKLSLDLELEIPKYVLIGSVDKLYKDLLPEDKFKVIYNIESKLESVFFHLRLGDWKTAHVHLNQIKPDENLSQLLINDINKDMVFYIEKYYINKTIEDLSGYYFNNGSDIILKRKFDNEVICFNRIMG